jgi:hypothetical protein
MVIGELPLRRSVLARRSMMDNFSVSIFFSFPALFWNFLG